jgi:hypothetical protein
MSNLQLITSLQLQKAELEALISEASADGDIVGKINFETRLNVVSEELEALRELDSKVAEVALLFDGAPVDGTEAIDANFATLALSYFQSIVTTLFASNLRGELAKRGKIKGSELAALNIRGIATGSFGFVLEEKDARQSSAVKTTVREAVEEAADLFEEFTQIEDNDFLIDVDEISPRVFNALGKFFSHLEKGEASLKTSLPDRQLNFDRASIERAYRRISETIVKIEPVTWTGTLVGLSPIKRTFDFKKDGAKEITSGKFSHQVSQDYLERIEGQDGITLGARFRADIEIGTIRKPNGNISVSYTVNDLEEIS